MSTCLHAKAGGTCKKEHKGAPQAIRCTLPRAGEFCRNGKECLYTHGSAGAGSSSNARLPKCASPHYPPHRYIAARKRPKRKRHRIYKFDSTLGYPGEGPSKIVSYNIAGAKNKIKNVLSDANSSGVDAILLQEVHAYADNWHCNRGLGFSADCNSKGWRVFAAHGNASDASAGCAVLIRLNSTKVKIALDANKKPKFTAALEGSSEA
eukprot:scaffold1649_cov134-Isochrysis_galbana.AAC.10